MKNMSSKRKDALSITCVAILIFLTVYVLLGFGKYGLRAPSVYSGGDDFITYFHIKSIADTGWTWFNNYVGAPYGSTPIDFPASSLSNFEYLVFKVMGLFTGDPIVIANLCYLLIFPTCAVTAFIVLRHLKLRRLFALAGAVLFSLMPFIFFRRIGHFYYSTCYMVPFTILLCVWAYDPESGGLPRKWSVKKKAVTVLLALLIASNGYGYYAFFSCVLLLATVAYSVISRRSFKAGKNGAIMICLIAGFFAAALVPMLVFKLRNGVSAGSVVRSPVDGELYGLKIAQLFIPLNSHGIGLIEKIMARYNNNMPLVNENASAYLGVGGGIGFLLSLVFLFVPHDKEEDGDGAVLQLFSKLNICAVLYATVGGFSSLIALAGFTFVRGYNRISVYMMFISIGVLLICLQKLSGAIRERNNKVLMTVFTAVLALCFGVCVFDLLPTYGSADGVFEANTAKYQSDKSFVEEIEAQMEPGDSIYQLPYEQYQEGGDKNLMPLYHEFAGYLYSHDLKWSFGGVRNRSSDRWNSYVDSMPIGLGIDAIVRTGFRGLYIEALAYTEDELAQLRQSVEELLQEQPLVSEDGTLLFYDLHPYADAHPEVTALGPVDVEGLSERYFPARTIPVTGNAVRGLDSVTLYEGGTQFGPYITCEPGDYEVTVRGDDLDICSFDAAYEAGTKLIELLNVTQEKERISYEMHISETINDVEFRLFNNSEKVVTFNYIELRKK